MTEARGKGEEVVLLSGVHDVDAGTRIEMPPARIWLSCAWKTSQPPATERVLRLEAGGCTDSYRFTFEKSCGGQGSRVSSAANRVTANHSTIFDHDEARCAGDDKTIMHFTFFLRHQCLVKSHADVTVPELMQW